MPIAQSNTASATRAMLAAIPSVDRVLNMAATQALIFEYGRMPVLTAIRAMLTELRDNVAQAHILPADIFAEPAINLHLQ